MARKPNYRFEKRRKEEARQKRQAKKRNSKQNKGDDEKVADATDHQPAPTEDDTTALPE